MRIRLLLITALLPLAGCASKRPLMSDSELAAVVRENEALAVKVCREFVRAQVFYAQEDRDGDGVREYAQIFRPTRGGVDGLGDAVAGPVEIGGRWSTLAKSRPAHGYCYAILTHQGAAAPGGVRDYFIGGHLTAGFALIAWPAHYGTTGRETLLVNQSGIVMEKDLGSDTTRIAQRTREFDPDSTWHIAAPQPRKN